MAAQLMISKANLAPEDVLDDLVALDDIMIFQNVIIKIDFYGLNSLLNQ